MASERPIPKSIVTYNNQQYEFELLLFNDKFNIYIPHNLVESIVIVDSIYNVFDSVVITLFNSKNAIDLFSDFKKGQTNQVIEKLSFNFLGGGNDAFILRLKPSDHGLESVQSSTTKNNNFELSYQLIINDEDELLDSDGVTKKRVFSCIDAREYLLKTDMRGWSTINEPSVAKFQYRVRQLDNNNRRSFTGDFIKYVIGESLKDTEPKFADDWDSGASVLFYTSPQNYSAFDDVDYLLSSHVSKEIKDNCILKFERDGEFSLRPYHKIIEAHRDGKNIGPFMQDFFTFQDNVSDKAGTKKEGNGIIGKALGFFKGLFSLFESANNSEKFSWDDVTALGNFPDLPDYNFLNRTGIDGYDYLKTYAVHAYELGNKQFETYQKENNIDAQDTYIAKNYIKKFGGKKPSTAFYVDEQRRTNINFESRFSLPDDFRIYLKDGRNRSIQKYFDSAPSISFNIEGYSHRRSTRFMTINSSQLETESVFANLFSGEWLVTQVVHTFSGKEYTTNITGVKLYYYDEVGEAKPTEKNGLFDKIKKVASFFSGN